MSKKNNKGTKRKAHAHDREREIAANKEKVIKKEKADKSLAKKAEAGIVKKKTTKFKAARIRRGATVKGIKVVDSETRKLAKKLVKADQAKRMDVDGGSGAKDPLALRKTIMKRKAKPSMKQMSKAKKAAALAHVQSMKMVIG